MEAYTAKDLRKVPEPPRLHWGIVLALQIVTLGIFGLVWFVVQAVWVRRMTGRNSGLIWAIINLCAFPLVVLLIMLFGSMQDGTRILFVVLNLATALTLRSQMEAFPIGMSLSGGLTFLLGTMYLQYHLRNYVLPEPVDVFGPVAGAPAYVPPTSLKPTP